MFVDDDAAAYGPSATLFPVSGLQEEKKRKPQLAHSYPVQVSSSDEPHSVFLTNLSTLIPLPSPGSPPPPSFSSPSTTQSVQFVDHHVAYYQHYLASPPPSLSRPASGAHLRVLQSQAATWTLLHHLRTSESFPSPPPLPLDAQFSHRHAVLNLISASPQLTRALAVIDWLEELAEGTAVFEAEGAVTWKRTLRRLQRGGGDGEAALSVDCELVKGGRVFEDGDREEEALLLRSVWQLMRAGKVQDAVRLCVDFRQPWRAASISGGQLWHNAGGEDEDGQGSVGHQRHFLFKAACRRLAAAAAVGSHERAVYGLLGSELSAVLGVSHSWEDVLWSMLRVMVDRDIDAMLAKQLRDDSERQHSHAVAAPALTTAQVFERITHGDDSIPAAAKQAAKELYHHLQRLLVLGDYTAAEDYVAERVRQDGDGEHDDDLLPFAVHLYLYLHPDCPHAPLNDNGRLLFVAYIRYLQRLGHHHLIPLYASYLSHSDQVLHYSAFLRALPTVPERIKYLRLAQEYFPSTVLRITTVLVQGVIEDADRDHHPAMPEEEDHAGEPGGRGPVSAHDREVIACLDCFGVSSTSDPAAVLEAMRLSTLLFRSFLHRGRLSAAKLLSDSLLTHAFDQFIAMEGEDEEEHVSNLEAAKRHIEHEYVGWMLYIKALNWLSAWSSKLSVKPRPPQPIKASAAMTAQQERNDRKRWQRELAKHEAELTDWRAGWEQVSTSTIEALLYALQQDGCGWMRRAGPEVEEWRRRLVPDLLFMLQRVCDVSERGAECLQVAELVVDERYRLYDVMDVEERRALLVKVKDSYLRYWMQPEEERRRSSVTAPTSSATVRQHTPPAAVEAELDDEDDIEEEADEAKRREQEHKYDEPEPQLHEVPQEDEEPSKGDEPMLLEDEQPMQEQQPETAPEPPVEETSRRKAPSRSRSAQRQPSPSPEPLRRSPRRASPPLPSPPRDSPPRVNPPRASPPRASPPRGSPPRDSPTREEPEPVGPPVVAEPSPSPPRDDFDMDEPSNPPVSVPPPPEPAPVIPSSPAPTRPPSPPAAVDDAESEPASEPLVADVETEGVTRKSSRPRRGASAARSEGRSVERSVEREVRAPTRAASDAPATPLAESHSVTSAESRPRRSTRASSRRMSKPVEPSTRVLRTRK